MDVDRAKLEKYSAASARLIDCRETLDSRVVSTEKAKEDLCWAGKLLESIDWECANYETASQDYQLSDLSSTLRTLFYGTLAKLGEDGFFSKKKISDPLLKARIMLENVYAALKTGELNRINEQETILAIRLFDEFREYLPLASQKPEDD